MNQQAALEYIRHGQAPFFRLPLADLSQHGPAAYRGASAVLIGVPYDGGTTYQPGARFAPYQVRRVSALVNGFHPTRKLDVFSTIRALDGGNIPAPPFDAQVVRSLIAAEVAAILDAGAAPFLVGGDHSITLPALRAVSGKHGALAVVHVDAHFDTSGPEVWGEAHHHGTPIRHALAEGLIERGQLYQLGIRVTWKDADEAGFSLAHGAHVFGMEHVEQRGISAIVHEIKERIGDRPVYVTFDIDAVDPAFAPGTGTPVSGGLTSREALGMVRALAGLRLVGMDVVEVLPALDHGDATCNLAAHLLFEGLTVLALASR
jgi:agmatinase